MDCLACFDEKCSRELADPLRLDSRFQQILIDSHIFSSFWFCLDIYCSIQAFTNRRASSPTYVTPRHFGASSPTNFSVPVSPPTPSAIGLETKVRSSIYSSLTASPTVRMVATPASLPPVAIRTTPSFPFLFFDPTEPSLLFFAIPSGALL